MKPTVEELTKVLQDCVNAMNHSQKIGCTDHLDCNDDGGDFWYDAIDAAEKILDSI